MFILDDVFQIKNRGIVVTGVWDSDESIAVGDHVRRRSDGKFWPVCGVEMYRPLSAEGGPRRKDRIGLYFGIRCTKDDFNQGDVFDKCRVVVVPEWRVMTILDGETLANKHIEHGLADAWTAACDFVQRKKVLLADDVLGQLGH